MPALDTKSETETTLLEELDFSHTPKCDNEICDNDATHLIRCHCGSGTEYSCLTCITNMRQDAIENPAFGGFIQFDGSKACGHLSLIILCKITPL